MRYLLDANAIIALLNDTTSPIARRVRRHAPRDFGVSAVVIHELYYGAFKGQPLEQNVARVDALHPPSTATGLTPRHRSLDPPPRWRYLSLMRIRAHPSAKD